MNPVIQWTALPDGSHESFRVPVTAMSAAWGAAAAGATLQRPAKRGLERYFSPIHDTHEAKEAIDDSTGMFFVIAAVNVLAGLLLHRAFLVDAVIIAGLAFVLRQSQSKAAAFVLLALMGLSFASRILGMFGVALLGAGAGGGVGGLMLSFFAVALAYRAMTATVTLERHKA
jgi:hypothetical protein